MSIKECEVPLANIKKDCIFGKGHGAILSIFYGGVR